MNIKKIFILVLAVLLILSTFAGCRKVNSDGSYISSTSSDVTINYSNVEIIDDNSEPESVIEITSEVESTIDTSSIESTPTTDTVVTDDVDTTDGNVIGGDGEVNTPYEGYLSDDGILVTVDIPAGKSVFYNIRGISNRYLAIESPDAYVVFNDTKYTANAGKVYFFLESDTLASDYLTIEVGNAGSTDTSFTVVFTDVAGSVDNPNAINNAGKNTVTFEKNESDAINYEYKATKNGKVRFQITSINNTANTSFENASMQVWVTRGDIKTVKSSTDTNDLLTDENGSYLELEVEKDETIYIEIKPEPNARGKYPGVVVEWLIQE